MLVALVTGGLCGCSDDTLPFRESLAVDLTNAVAWRDPNIESIPIEIQRLHIVAGLADATADACEACLASKPPFDRELIELITVYGRSSRRLETQYRQAIEDGRTKLNEAEMVIANECQQADHVLFMEILERIDYNELVNSR
jgi:hypothetical protein